MRRAGVLLLALAALAVPGSAGANGDPASDVLLTSQVYVPFEAPISKSAAKELRDTVAAANARGYTIRVALIAFTGDLGTAVSLWGHPQDYSKFLWSELAFVYKNRLLVVMTAGFGFYNRRKPVAKERRVLAKVKPGKTPTPLAQSASEAVRALAASAGVTLPKASGDSSSRDRLIILGAAAVAFAAVLLFPTRWLRRRTPTPRATK